MNDSSNLRNDVLRAVQDLTTQQTEVSQATEKIRYAVEQTQHMLEGLVSGNLNQVEEAILHLNEVGDANLFSEVGKLTRDLHSSLSDLRNLLGPRVKEMTEHDMPEAADRLAYVIEMTNNAAHKTLGICEEKFQEHEDLDAKVAELAPLLEKMTSYKRRPRKKVDEFIEKVSNLKIFLDEFSSKSQNDLTEIMMAQDFQDLTGQVLVKVVNLIGELETNLASVIQRFGPQLTALNDDVNDAGDAGEDPPVETGQSVHMNGGPGKDAVKQDEVDSLLAELGF